MGLETGRRLGPPPGPLSKEALRRGKCAATEWSVEDPVATPGLEACRSALSYEMQWRKRGNLVNQRATLPPSTKAEGAGLVGASKVPLVLWVPRRR